MANEHILTLIRAALQAPTAEDKNRILQVIIDAWPSGETQPMAGIAFPLPIYCKSKKLGRRVKGLLFEDKTIEVEGTKYSSPSSNEMCDIVLGYHTTMWPVWKYVAPDGKPRAIDHLREPGAPLAPKGKPAQ